MRSRLPSSTIQVCVCPFRSRALNLAILLSWLLARDEESIGLRAMTSAPEVLAQFSHCCCGCEQILPPLRTHPALHGSALKFLPRVLVLDRGKFRSASVVVKELHPHGSAFELADAPDDKILPER